MGKATATRRGTAMPDSDVKELVSQWNQGGSYWVLNSAIAVNTTQFSLSAFVILGTNATAIRVTAAGTGGGFTGVNLVTGNVMIVAAYITQAGTHGLSFGTSAGSFGGAAIPTVPSTAYAYGCILIKASTTSGFTGGTTVLDGTNASALFINLNGPAGFAFSTGRLSVVPG